MRNLSCWERYVQRKSSPCFFMKAYRGSENIAPLILHLSTNMEMSGQFNAPTANPGTHFTGGWVGPGIGMNVLFQFQFWVSVVCKSKGKVCPVHAMKAYSGSRGIAPLIRNLGVRLRGVVNITPWPLLPLRKNRGARWVGCWDVSEKRKEKKNIFPLPGLEPRPVQLRLRDGS
jgi:hypothetical protein